MKHRAVFVVILIVTVLMSVGLVPATAIQPEETGLIQIVWQEAKDLDQVEAVGIPIYARLTSDGESYLLAGAAPEEIEALQTQGLAVTLLDPDLRGATYYLAYLMPGQPLPDWDGYGRLLLDDGVQVLLRTTPQDAERLAGAGVELRAVTLTPKPLRPAAVEHAFPTTIDPDPIIQIMIDQVTSTMVYSYTGDLSGEWPVEIGSQPYTIQTRYTYSGVPIEKATQFVGDHLANLGLDVEYHQWGGSTYPNVIGELPGLTNPEDIFIICAHLDSITYNNPMVEAPGADDNASGSVAVLMAADILTQYQWGCTLRFALWTGEEQGLLGSQVYAQRSYQMGENIIGVLNLDMIAWNTPSSSPDIDLHARSSIPESLVLAQLFTDVVDAYNLNLIPEIDPSGTGASDHASFWQYGYTAILGIEDFGDFNPYYHSELDLLQYLDIPYFTDFVKASIATFAHMSGCLIPSGTGYLDGTVTAQSGGAPIEDATVTMSNSAGHTWSTSTNASGYYTQALLADTYTVTAEAYAYLPVTVTGVTVMTDAVTTQDFSLQPMPAIVVEPLSLEAVLYPDEFDTQTLWVTNTGGTVLTYTIHEAGRDLHATRSPVGRPRSEPLVDAQVWSQIEAGGQTRVLIYLGEQADLTPAQAINDWAERGRFVYGRLQETAERSGGELRDLLEEAGAQPRVLLAANAIAATVDAPLLEVIAARPEVARIGPNRILSISPLPPGEAAASIETVEWNIAYIGADQAWNTLGITGDGVTVGIVDSGVLYTHSALVDPYRGNLGGGSFDHNYNWFDFAGGLSEPYDDLGHGTFATGIVVGDEGGVNQIGVAPGAEWIAVKTDYSTEQLHAALDWMLAPTDLGAGNADPDQRPQVGLGPWNLVGCDTEFQPDLQAWRAADIVPVFRPGSNGPGCSTLGSPGDLPEAFTATATDASDNVSSSSSRGPSCWGEVKPEVAAPGVNIRSSNNAGGYETGSGTSWSVAHLAGTAALVLSADPDLSPDEVESTIEQTAVPRPDAQCGDPGPPNNVYGWGRIDAFEAVSLTLTGLPTDIPWLSVEPVSGTLDPGEGMPIAVTFDAGGLAPDTYLGLLDVESSDLATPHVSVPVTLTVLAPPCEPVQIEGVITETESCAVTFGTELTGTSPYSLTWDFGAFGPSTEPTPTVDFGASGTYPYTVTALNCGGVFSDTITDTVTVACTPADNHYVYLPLVLRGE